MIVYVIKENCCGCDSIQGTAYRTEADAEKAAGKWHEVIEVELVETHMQRENEILRGERDFGG